MESELTTIHFPADHIFEPRCGIEIHLSDSARGFAVFGGRLPIGRILMIRLLIAVLLGSFSLAQAQLPGSVVITEIMYDDTSGGANPDLEWVEIYNTTLGTISIGGWVLTDGNIYPPPSPSEGTIQIPFGTLIHPGEYLVLAKQSIPEIPGTIVCTEFDLGWGLNNLGDNLALFTASAGGLLIDGSLVQNYPDYSPSNAGYSIEKCNPTAPWWQPDSSQWHASTFVFSPGRFRRCTPRQPNSACTLANDHCANAIPVGTGTIGFSNVGATTDGPNDPYPCDVPSDIWYCFEVFAVPCPRTVQISLCGSGFDTQLAVYWPTPDCQCPSPGMSMMCDDDFCGAGGASQVVFSAPPGFYMIRVGGWAGAQGTGTMTISFVDPPPPHNDCVNAQVIPSGTLGYTTCGATTDGPDEPAACNFFSYTQVGSDVWYRWQAPCTGNTRVSVCGSNYDSKVAIYNTDSGGTCPAGATAIACNDDFCGLQSELNFSSTQDNWYLIRVGGYNNARGSGSMTVEMNPPCVASPCVNVGYIRVTPSDGLPDHTNVLNYISVELTNLLPQADTITLEVTTCTDTQTVEVPVNASTCNLYPLPMVFTPTDVCGGDFVRVRALNNGSCSASSTSVKPFKVLHDSFTITKRFDSSSPTFHTALANGNHIKTVLLTCRLAGDSVTYLKVRLGANTYDSFRDPIKMYLFRNDGPGGLPGTVLMADSGLTTRSAENWVVYAIPSAPVPVNGTAFYAGVSLASHCAPGGIEAVGCDAAVDTPGVYYEYISGAWSAFTPPGDMMIEAGLRGPCETDGQSLAMAYEYQTSDDPGGPVFNWEDISTTGTSWSDSCPQCNYQPLPISFPFCGVYQTQLKISLNGFIAFQPNALGSSHQPMPNTSEPNSVIAPLWTESEFCYNYSGEIYYQAAPDLTHYTVQWQNILANGERISFQAILHSNGDIVCHYLDAPSFLNYTCGIENSDGTQALQVYSDGGCPPVRNMMAIRFRPLLPPLGPQAFVINFSGTDILLNWNQVPGAACYEIYASEFPNFPPGQTSLVATTSDTSFADEGAAAQLNLRFYQVIANNVTR